MSANNVTLVGHYGGDLTHAASAWTSTDREKTERDAHRIPGLLKYLANNKHETPFEKSMLHFVVTTDIATHVQLAKHRIGVSMNAESARYKELKEDKAYVPDDWPEAWQQLLEKHITHSQYVYHEALKALEPTLGRKRAKESARFFLPYASQITADVSFNFRSFVHFYRLRADPHAQLEIRQIAEMMLDLIKNIDGNPFEHTINAFGLGAKDDRSDL